MTTLSPVRPRDRVVVQRDSLVSICKSRREFALRFLLLSRLARRARIPAPFSLRCFNARPNDDNRDRFHRWRRRVDSAPVRAGRCQIFFGFPGISGMNADHGVNIGILFRDLDRAAGFRLNADRLMRVTPASVARRSTSSKVRNEGLGSRGAREFR